MSETSQETAQHSWVPLITVCLAMFVVVVDTTMMNVAIPAIVAEFETTVQVIQTTVTMYALVMASFMLTGGKLGSIYGAKGMFRLGALIYGAGTLTAAISPSVFVLFIGWSLIEGLGAALLLPLAMTLIVANYQGTQRAVAFGVLAGVQASGAAVGPILGGILTQYFSWRWGFGLEAIIVVAVLVLAPRLIDSDKNSTQKVDWIGTALSSSGLALIVLSFILSSTYGIWTATRPFFIGETQLDLFGLSPVPYLIGVGLFMLLGFYHWQKYRVSKGNTPLLNLNLFSIGAYKAGMIIDSLQIMILSGLMFILPIFMQTVLGFEPMQTGLALIPLSLSIFAVSLSAPRLGTMVIRRVLIQVGIAVMIVGILFLRNSASPAMTGSDMILPFLIIGVGVGLMLSQITSMTLSTVNPVDSSEASGVIFTAKQLGTSMGTAIIGSVMIVLIYGTFVANMADLSGVDLTYEERRALSIALEDSANGNAQVEIPEGMPDLSEVSQEELVTVNNLALESAVQAMQQTLMLIVVLLVFALGVSTFLPGGRVQDVVPPPPLPNMAKTRATTTSGSGTSLYIKTPKKP